MKNTAGTRDYTESGIDYTLLRYLNGAIDNPSNGPEMIAVAEAAKDYCYAARNRFDGTTDEVRDVVDAVTIEQVDEYASVREGELPDGVEVDGITVMVESDNSLRIYFKYDDEIDPNNFTYTVDGKTVSLQKSKNGGYYITATKIVARKLNVAHTFTISDGENTYSLKASVMTYVRSDLKKAIKDAADGKEVDEANLRLSKALYLYNLAAINCWPE